MRRTVVVLSSHRSENEEMSNLLASHDLVVESIYTIDHLESWLEKQDSLAVFIDTDSIALDNKTIRQLNRKFPSVNLLLFSAKRIHPDLKEAIGQYVYACISKPIDPEEVSYWLKCIQDDDPKTVKPD